MSREPEEVMGSIFIVELPLQVEQTLPVGLARRVLPSVYDHVKS